MAREGKLAEIVGRENVIRGARQLEAYAKDLSFAPHVRPRCIVKPANTDEVQAVMKWANETLTAVVPVSSGPPHFRGDTIPSRGGTIILDLSRMNKIYFINEKHRVAMVQPGVTYSQLLPQLDKAGFCAYMPLCPRGSKSVIAGMLDREPITMPVHQWDSMDPMLSVETIFGTGDKLRGGDSSERDLGAIEEQIAMGKTFMNPAGLSQFGENRLCSGAQGTIGIITWATLKIRQVSLMNKTLLTPSDTLEPLVELSYSILRIRSGEYHFILNGLNLATLLARTPKEIRALRAALPRWILVTSFEGYYPLPEEEIKYQVDDFRELAGPLGVEPQVKLPGVDAQDLRALLPRAAEEPYWKIRFKGAFQDIFFLTTLDKTSMFTDDMAKLAQSRGFCADDIGVYIQPKVQGTSCHVEFNLYYDASSPTETEKTKWLVEEGARHLAKMGGLFSRPHGMWVGFAYSGGPQNAMLQRKVKRIFDPNGILNPGKLCF